jgi:hypothetical protein
MNKRPDVYLELALRALERVPRFLAGRSLEAYLADDLCQSAVERQLEVAGDALGQVRKVDLDLFARGFPHDVFTTLREESPVHWQPFPPDFPGRHDPSYFSDHLPASLQFHSNLFP